MSGVPGDPHTLLDWKRQIAELYARVRSSPEPEAAWDDWKRTRERLFTTHPQSPLPADDRGAAPAYFDYDPAMRVLGDIRSAPEVPVEVTTSTDGTYSFIRYATVAFSLGGADRELDLLWLTGYGGGLFLSFRDSTSGTETYGACRYLYDTVKGADLGTVDEKLVLDFNFSYNPSCSYDPRWSCPLAVPANRLDIPIRAGERTTRR